MTPSRKKLVCKTSLPPKPVGLRELAQYLKLSPATVSVVINDSPAAKAIPVHTKERVLQAAKKLEYRANFFARSLSLRRGFMVGVVVPELSEGYAASIMRGIESQLLAEGYCYFVDQHAGTLLDSVRLALVAGDKITVAFGKELAFNSAHD